MSDVFDHDVFLSAIWPLSFLEASVHLSYAALLGIYLGLPHKGQVVHPLWTYLRVQFLACLFTNLVSFAWFDRFSSLSFIMNPIFSPLLSFIGVQIGLASAVTVWLDIAKDGKFLGLLIGLLEYLLLVFKEIQSLFA